MDNSERIHQLKLQQTQTVDWNEYDRLQEIIDELEATK